MSLLASALIGAGVSALGSLGSTGISYASNKALQENAQSFNKTEAQLNRDFQERMSSTAYQRQVDDMRKAGINPALASGSGSSTPGGSSASSPGASAHSADLSNVVNTFLKISQQQSSALSALALRSKNTNDASHLLSIIRDYHSASSSK